MIAFISALAERYLRPLVRRLRLEQGLEAVEYALIGALVVAAILVAVNTTLRTGLTDAFTYIQEQLSGAPDGV